MSGDTDDEILMSRYAGGELEAFEILYTRHKQATYRFFLRQLGKESAADCHQELWMKLINSASRYSAEGKFVALLYTIAHNVLTDFYRRNKKHQLIDASIPSDELDLAADTLTADSELNRERLRSRLMNLVSELPHAQKEVFLLREEGGLSIKEIAVATGAGEEGIKSRLRYAMQKLKSGMQAYV